MNPFTAGTEEYDEWARQTLVEGAALLDEVRAAVTRFVALPSPYAAVAVVLWVVATHAISAWEHATRLAMHSAVKRCGKSRLLEVVEALAHDALATTNISVAALFRVIDKGGDTPPTLILDEADRLFGTQKKDEDNRDLIALLNNGFRPGKPTWRCVGPTQVATPFRNFAMAVVAGIGRKPDTIEDRAVNITMRRQLPDEQVARSRLRRDVPELHALRDRIRDWVIANLDSMTDPCESIPDELEDRQADAWEPLLTIADVAGGDWPKLARDAAMKLSAEAVEDDSESIEIRLLADVRSVFEPMPHVTFLSSKVLLTELRGIEDAPWGDFDFTTRKLAIRLGKFGVKPRRNTAGTERGYHLEELYDVFRRCLRQDPSEPVRQGSDQGKRSDTSLTVYGSASGSVRPVSNPSEQNPRSEHVWTLSDGF